MKADFVFRAQTTIRVKNVTLRRVPGKLMRRRWEISLDTEHGNVRMAPGDSLDIGMDFGGVNLRGGRVSRGLTVEFDNDGLHKIVDGRKLEP